MVAHDPLRGSGRAVLPHLMWLTTLDAVAGFFFAFTVYGILTQLVVYLLGIGYRPAVAAIVLSLTLGLNAVGKVLFGVVAGQDAQTATRSSSPLLPMLLSPPFDRAS